MTLKTLIADDEALARKRLRQLLASDPAIDVIQECCNGEEAIASLKTSPVDLVFLDIQMPGNTGFEVIEAIGPARMPHTIFVTAHHNYAVQAFAVHALDYLVKPIDQDRLMEALGRVKRLRAAESALTMQNQLNGLLQTFEANRRPDAYPERLLVPNGAEDMFIAVSEIEWIEAADDYACLHVGGKVMMLRQTIRQLAENLDPKRFVRVHRSSIVNVSYVQKILREGRTDGWLQLSTGQRIRMSKTGWQSLLDAMAPSA
jgi:two-component system LytT family response regulator